MAESFTSAKSDIPLAFMHSTRTVGQKITSGASESAYMPEGPSESLAAAENGRCAGGLRIESSIGRQETDERRKARSAFSSDGHFSYFVQHKKYPQSEASLLTAPLWKTCIRVTRIHHDIYLHIPSDILSTLCTCTSEAFRCWRARTVNSIPPFRKGVDPLIVYMLRHVTWRD
jgi:hypothetical protein